MAFPENSYQKIIEYFPELSDQQQQQIKELYPLYEYWNNQINVISRKDIEALYIRHVLHSLAIAKFIQFQPNAEILDIGTGGGFPGIPLAIFFPETQFYLTDSIGKKIKVVSEVATALKLENVTPRHTRSEKVKHQFDFVVTRAVAQMKLLRQWSRGKLKPANNHAIENGIIMLKGGDLQQEIAESGFSKVNLYNLNDWFAEPFFETKKLAYATF